MKILWIITLFTSLAFSDVRLLSHSKVLSDPINNTTNPKRIPHSTIRYYYEIINDSPDSLKDVVFKTDVDVKILDISQSHLMIDKKHLLKSTSFNPNTGEIEMMFLTLPAYAQVLIMIDTILR